MDLLRSNLIIRRFFFLPRFFFQVVFNRDFFLVFFQGVEGRRKRFVNSRAIEKRVTGLRAEG